MSVILDRFSRPLTDLRVSVTDRCNLRCPYCMPREAFGAGYAFMPRTEQLTFEEIARLCRVFARVGVRRLRLTGGEPLLRRGLERLVAMLASVEGIDEIALTTNGTMFARKARLFASAGLDRVTVSLDSLDDTVFEQMTDSRSALSRVLDGVDAATAAGLHPVKVNMVVRRGVNDRCVLAMAEHFRGRPEVLRFIEYMDVGSTNGWQLAEVVPAAEILAAIRERWPVESIVPARRGEVASRYRYRDGAGEIGFIHSVSEPFCGECTRARLSADGKLYTCLFATHGHDLRGPLRAGADNGELEARVRGVWSARRDRYSAERALRRLPRGESEPDRRRETDWRSTERRIEMSYIGG